MRNQSDYLDKVWYAAPVGAWAARCWVGAMADPEPATKLMLTGGALALTGIALVKGASLLGSPTTVEHEHANGHKTRCTL